MKLTKNYHDYSMVKERQLFANLQVFYGELLISLNALKDLTTETIGKTIDEWHRKYDPEIEDVIRKHVSNLQHYVKNLLQESQAQTEIMPDQAKTLFDANITMLNVTTEYVRQKFIEIGVNEKAYG